MDKKIILLTSLILLVGLIGFVFGISQSDFQNVIFNDNRGSVDDASRGHVTYNINITLTKDGILFL